MNLTAFDRLVWAASLYGMVLLLGVLWIRGTARSFPVFTAFLASGVLRSLVLHLVLYHRSSTAYFDAYYSFGFLDEILQLLVFYELATNVFCPTGVWARDVRRTFLGLVAFSTLVAALLTWLAHPNAERQAARFLLRTDLFTSALMSELFVGILALAVTFGLPWKTHAARIAQGLGAYSVICVVKDIFSTSAGVARSSSTYRDLSHLRILVFLACEAYWIAMLWKKAPEPRELPEAMRTQIYTLQKQVERDLARIRAWRKN